MSESSDWYKSRDNRTRRTVDLGGFDSATVGIRFHPRVSESEELQVAGLITVGILSRWCRVVRVDVPSARSLLKRLPPGQYGDALLAAMKHADPFGNFTIGSFASDDVSQILEVGRQSTGNTLWIDSAGWIAGVGTSSGPGPEARGESNHLGAMLAACLGNAELFKRSNGAPAEDFASWYSLFDFKRAETPVGLGNPSSQATRANNLDVVGCGAIGSSFVYLLPLTTLAGRIRLIDYDSIKAENCNSSLAFGYRSLGVKKSAACHSLLKESGVDSHDMDMDFSAFVKSGLFYDAPYIPQLTDRLLGNYLSRVWADGLSVIRYS